MQLFLVDRDPVNLRYAAATMTAYGNASPHTAHDEVGMQMVLAGTQLGMTATRDAAALLAAYRTTDTTDSRVPPCDPARFWAQHPAVSPEALRLHILLSYHYFKGHDLDTFIPKKFAPPYPTFFADSGAFSALTLGATIRWQDYAAWLTRYRHWFAVMANLDVIGSPSGTATNQAHLEDAGLPVLPVFHTGEPWDILEALCAKYPYIALGGMVRYAPAWKTTLMPWLIRCFQLAQGRSVFHGFGCTTWAMMKALPWHSVDSSSWGAGFRFGSVPLFDWRRSVFRTIKLGQGAQDPATATLIRDLGFAPHDFALRARNTRQHNAGIAALSYCLAAAWLQRYWAGHGDATAKPHLGIEGGVFLVEGKSNLGDTRAPAACLAAYRGAYAYHSGV